MQEAKTTSFNQNLMPLTQGLCEWRWPKVEQEIDVRDKYSGESRRLSINDGQWKIKHRGYNQNIIFAAGDEGLIQRTLAVITQRANGTQSLVRFCRTTIQNWDLYKQILIDGPMKLHEFWESNIKTIDQANAGKSILLLVAKLQLGNWDNTHVPIIKALDTKAAVSLNRQRANILTREHLLPTAASAEITRVLDECASLPKLSERELQGLAALALMYQHGLRPIQIVLMSVEDTTVFLDDTGLESFVINVYPVKRGDSAICPPSPRAVLATWVPLFLKLHSSASQSGRTRLFSFSTTDALATAIRQVCKARGFRIDVKAGQLRHSGAQALADAGHDRESIKGFLTQKTKNSSRNYHGASRRGAETINKALGTSKLYTNLIDGSKIKWISVEELQSAPEDEQVGGIIGDRLIAGTGRCKRKQSRCTYDPVVACYGCHKFIPVKDIDIHIEAISGMRANVLEFLNDPAAINGNAVNQLQHSIARAQGHIDYLRGTT
jgi:hypothetical protein